jgi:hypothetical protein
MKGGIGWIVIAGVVVVPLLGSCGKKERAGDSDELATDEEAPGYLLASEGQRLPTGATMISTSVLTWTDAVTSLERGGRKEFGTMTMRSEAELQTEMTSDTTMRVVVRKDQKTVNGS